MTITATKSTATLADVRRELTARLTQVMSSIQTPGCTGDDLHGLHNLQEVRTLLGSLPLDTTAYALATGRVQNAASYLATGEFGAARYELRLLLASQLEPV